MSTGNESEITEIFECDDYLYENPLSAHRAFYAIRGHLNPGAKILDIGCGPGIAVKYLREQGYEAYGIDSRDIVPEDGRIFFREDARHTHFPHNFFDLVTERLVFAQLTGKNKREDVVVDIMREAKRTMKPGSEFYYRLGCYVPKNTREQLGFSPINISPWPIRLDRLA